MKKYFIPILVGIIVLFALFILGIRVLSAVIFSADTAGQDLTTDTWSTDFSSHDEKISFLETYIQCPAEVLDAEYHILYQDNSHGLVPEPSYWHMRAAIKVNPNEINAWTADMEAVSKEQIDFEWWSDLAIDTWDLSGTAVYYQRPEEQSYLVVYAEQGIVLKYFYVQ